jgi:hypothetical protein
MDPIGGGPLVSLAVATNVLASLTGSASGGLTIALDGGGLEMKVRRKRAVTRAGRRRIVRDLILAIVAAVGVVVAFEILMRILGWL